MIVQAHKRKVAIVTGSTKGIGRSIAQEMAATGTTVVVTGRKAEDAQRAAEAVRDAGGEALGLKFNIEERDDLASLIALTIDAFGRLDILVNNALSSSSVMPVDTLSDAQIEQAFTSNITNTYLLTRLAHPHLCATHGQVINIGSVIVNRHLSGLPVYSIVKAAMVQMTKVLAAEWAADGVRTNIINPGFIRTSAFSELGMPEDVVRKSYDFYQAYHPVGTVGEPSDVGRMAAYLASEAGNFMTGSVIEVDGGYSIQGLPLYQEG